MSESQRRYPKPLRELMFQFDELVEAIRDDVEKVGRNVSAAIRARKNIQTIRQELGLALRDAINTEKHRVHGAREWRRKRNRKRRKEAAE